MSTDQGVFVVYDGAEAASARNAAIPQIAYWNDDAREQLYFFDRLLLTLPDVGESIAALHRDLGIDTGPILMEKPMFAPLSKLAGAGSWRPASVEDVLAVMAGESLENIDGGVAGKFWECDCVPICHRPVDPLPTPVPGVSPDSLLRIAAAGAGCDGSPPAPPDPFRRIHPVIGKLMVMEDDLLINHFDPAICPFTEVAEEVLTNVNGSTYVAMGPFMLHRGGQELRTGLAWVATADGSDSVDLQIGTTIDDDVVGPDPQWTLNQTMRLNGEELTFYGSIIVAEASGNSYTLAGGWTYSVTDGPVIDPLSDAEFMNSVENMLAVDPPVVAGGGAPTGAVLSTAANVLTLWLNNLRDGYHPYAATMSCSGPIIQDGSGQSCAGVNIPCRAKIPEIAKRFIDSLTGVSQDFKKCMKGRFGCGGSNHPRLRIKCDDSSSCGPCGRALGCNLMGRDLWYCDTTNVSCNCVETVFHEAAHACGRGHSMQYYQQGYCSTVGPDAPCRIGQWFREQARLQGLCAASQQ